MSTMQNESELLLEDTSVAPPARRDLAEQAVRLLRSFPRPLESRQIAGFLAVCRAHPQSASALDYAVRKEEQAARAEQRLEQQFWSRARELLQSLNEDGETATVNAETGGRMVLTFAQHLAAENLLRHTLATDMHRVPTPRRGSGPNRGTLQHTGEERD